MMGKAMIIGAGLVALAMVQPVWAKDARCRTSDDGTYACSFTALDKSGSFRISAPGKPTFEVWVEGQGEAFASGQFEAGGRFVSLPGTYIRSKVDRACWVSDATDAEICAW